MQRQFRVDDTDPWLDRYGNSADGDVVISSNIADSARSGFGNTTITGNSGEDTANVGSGSAFSVGDLVLIHQSRGSGAGKWELNKILSKGSGNDWTLAYDLTQNYVSGAQVYRLPQYNSFTLDAGKTLTGEPWTNSLKGGIVCIIATQSININGVINLFGASSSPTTPAGDGGGFRGGQSDAGTLACGEGTAGASTSLQNSANGNGGGCGIEGGANIDNSGAGGAGGGNAETAPNGYIGANGSNIRGIGGSEAGNDELTLMVFGGGGGGGSEVFGNSGTAGGNGGGIVILIAPVININPSTGNINIYGGSSGEPVEYGHTKAAGGAGAGGSCLLKGQVINIGTNRINADKGGGGTNHGVASDGRVRIEYGLELNGDSTPSASESQQSILNNGGAMLALM